MSKPIGWINVYPVVQPDKVLSYLSSHIFKTKKLANASRQERCIGCVPVMKPITPKGRK